ncbi:MAG TPA: benzoate-CoA ligase family protein [Steroidobacteraceae bacterium]|jgi:benzoate-CoA ligase
MLGLSTTDRMASPPLISIPRDYNAAYDLLESNRRAGRDSKVAYIDDHGTCTYGELTERVKQFAHALQRLGLEPEQRVLLCLQDTVDFPLAFLGCIWAGVIPVAVNTGLKSADYQYLLEDSRARALVVSHSLLPQFVPALGSLPGLKHVIVSGGREPPFECLDELLTEPAQLPAPTCCDDACFWLYSSGSTGTPKGTIHLHASLIQTAELYARPVLGIREDDIVFSAAKLFFAYGLGNSLTFPLSVGATTVLMRERPTPEAIFARLQAHRPTIFCAVPTLYASILASSLPPRESVSLRGCVSAGEALPKDVGERWSRHFGVPILDGIGSTEMLHIFLSNRFSDICYGTTGYPVPGYDIKLVDESGAEVPRGEIGELLVAGPTSASGYWNNRAKSIHTFSGRWTRSGDKYYQDADGHFIHAGRADDMLKVSGLYVSPTEVESALLTHPSVLEAAVIGSRDPHGLVKPLACIVLKDRTQANEALADQLKQHVKQILQPHKYPRWVEFLAELPKTATGKIQRFKLRQIYPQGSTTSAR